MSSNESDLLDGESDELGFNSGSSGKHYFSPYLFVLTILLEVLVFWGLMFWHQEE